MSSDPQGRVPLQAVRPGFTTTFRTNIHHGTKGDLPTDDSSKTHTFGGYVDLDEEGSTSAIPISAVDAITQSQANQSPKRA
jgi:hypothetical protein